MKNIGKKYSVLFLVLLTPCLSYGNTFEQQRFNQRFTAGPQYFGKMAALNQRLCNPDDNATEKKIDRQLKPFARLPDFPQALQAGEAAAQSPLTFYQTLRLANPAVADIYRKQICLTLNEL